MTTASAFPDYVTVTDLATQIGRPVDEVLAMMRANSMPLAQANTVISQGVAERIARYFDGQRG